MNIRIGNDIKVKMPITDIGAIDATNILCAHCTFTTSKDQKTIPVFRQSTSYTIHGYSNLSYNVVPCNGTSDYTDLHNRGFVGCRHQLHNEYTSKCTISNGYIIAELPAEQQFCIGDYDCIFNIKVKEEGWDEDNLHSYRSSYYNVFALVDDNTGAIGSISIIPTSSIEKDLYAFCLNDTEISLTNGNYATILQTADNFSLSQLDTMGKLIAILGTNKRICIICNYDDLLFSYNKFMLPTLMYKLNNGSYLYVSEYLYSNITMSVNIIRSGVANTISTSQIVPDTPNQDTPSLDTPSSNTNVNKINGTSLKLFGTIDYTNLKVKGKVTNTNVVL